MSTEVPQLESAPLPPKHTFTMGKLLIWSIVSLLVGMAVMAAAIYLTNLNPSAPPSSHPVSPNPCGVRYVPVQVSVGKTVQRGGATFQLTEQKGTSGNQGEVSYRIDLRSTRTGVSTLVIDAAGSNDFLSTHSQSVVAVNLRPGDWGNYTFAPSEYLTGWARMSPGITDITACIWAK